MVMVFFPATGNPNQDSVGIGILLCIGVLLCIGGFDLLEGLDLCFHHEYLSGGFLYVFGFPIDVMVALLMGCWTVCFTLLFSRKNLYSWVISSVLQVW